MTSIRLGKWSITIGIVCRIIQNCIFGWNALPQSDAEKEADAYCTIIFLIGLFSYASPLFKLYESLVKKHNL